MGASTSAIEQWVTTGSPGPMESDSILGFDVSRSYDSWFIVLVQEQLGGFVTALPVDYHSKREVNP
jgi:hypothetical protein